MGRERVETHRARGEARDAASHSALYFDPSGRTRLINVNARSNAFGSSLLVNMSPLWGGRLLVDQLMLIRLLRTFHEQRQRRCAQCEANASELPNIRSQQLEGTVYYVSSKHRSQMGLPRECSRSSIMGSTSASRAVASEIISASHVELAVEPWRFERQDKGQQRFPSSLRISSHRPDGQTCSLLFQGHQPSRRRVDMTSTAVWRSSEDSSPTNSRSAA